MDQSSLMGDSDGRWGVPGQALASCRKKPADSELQLNPQDD